MLILFHCKLSSVTISVTSLAGVLGMSTHGIQLPVSVSVTYMFALKLCDSQSCRCTPSKSMLLQSTWAE